MRVKQVKKLTLAQLLELERNEKRIFGKAGLSRWLLPVVAQYGYLFVLFDDDRIQGSASFISNKETAFLVGLWIKEKLRKQGFGELLLTKTIAQIKKSSIKYLELTVQDNNTAAKKLYKKAGFKTVGQLEDFYGPSQSRILLRCNLLK